MIDKGLQIEEVVQTTMQIYLFSNLLHRLGISHILNVANKFEDVLQMSGLAMSILCRDLYECQELGTLAQTMHQTLFRGVLKKI